MYDGNKEPIYYRKPFAYGLIVYRNILRKKRFWLLFIVFIGLVFYVITTSNGGNKSQLTPITTTIGDKLNDNFRLLIYNSLLNDSKIDMRDVLVEIESFQVGKNEYKKTHDSLMRNYKLINPFGRPSVDTGKRLYTVLEYTRFFDRTKFCQLFDEKSELEYEDGKNRIYLSQCKYKNCIFTCNKDKVKDADAILFHEKDLRDQLYYDSGYLDSLLSKRKQNQIWMLWHDEPTSVDDNFDQIKFNWTLTYRLDAEISDCAYGCKYNKPKSVKNEQNFKTYLESLHIDFSLRKNSAFWFVSNCESMYRIEFTLNLKRHFPVYIYGVCSKAIDLVDKYSLLPATNPIVRLLIYGFTEVQKFFYGKRSTCGSRSTCEVNNVFSNKFYLSFESTNCTNYITEKFWRILRLGLIPVVIQPSKSIYNIVAPKDSYIHAEDFNFDSKRLADYLDRVSNDFTLYSKYFMWKQDYDIAYSAKHAESRRMCELCTLLNTENANIYYTSVSKWFNRECSFK